MIRYLIFAAEAAEGYFGNPVHMYTFVGGFALIILTIGGAAYVISAKIKAAKRKKKAKNEPDGAGSSSDTEE